jgi:hypothetical protein
MLGRGQGAAPRCRSPLDGGAVLPQPWLRRWCRHPSLLPAPTMSSPREFFPSPCFCAKCVGGLASEPGMLAYCNYAVLELVM